MQGTTPGPVRLPDRRGDRPGGELLRRASTARTTGSRSSRPRGSGSASGAGHGYEPGEFLRPRALAIDDERPDLRGRQLQPPDPGLRHPGQAAPDRGAAGGRTRARCAILTTWRSARTDCLYVCEYGNHRVQKFTLDGKPLGTWGGPGRGPGRAEQPLGPGRRRPGRGLGDRLEQPPGAAVPALIGRRAMAPRCFERRWIACVDRSDAPMHRAGIGFRTSRGGSRCSATSRSRSASPGG